MALFPRPETRLNPPRANMLARLALLFVLIPILELALLIQLGGWVGFPWTMGIVVLTGVMGATLARAEGLRKRGRHACEHSDADAVARRCKSELCAVSVERCAEGSAIGCGVATRSWGRGRAIGV